MGSGNLVRFARLPRARLVRPVQRSPGVSELPTISKMESGGNDFT